MAIARIPQRKHLIRMREKVEIRRPADGPRCVGTWREVLIDLI